MHAPDPLLDPQGIPGQVVVHDRPHAYVSTRGCHATRYNDETMEIHVRRNTSSKTMSMTLEDAKDFFENFPATHRTHKALNDVGRSYGELGQTSTQRTGGEGQRD